MPGGKRPGAGRPTNAAREAKKTAGAQAIARFSERALKDLDTLYEAQRDLALGVWVKGCSRCGKEEAKCRCREGPSGDRFYQRPPDQKAGAELIAHAKGRAAQSQVVSPETKIVLVHNVQRPPNRGNSSNQEVEEQEDTDE